jgi:hypothetical protein
MTTVEACQTLLAAIQALIEADEDVCEVETFQVTAAEPAAPSGQCTIISVWASQFVNAAGSMFHEDNPCVVIRGVQLNYRIDVCYSETEPGRNAAQHLADATCLYGLTDLVWCGLNMADVFGLKCSDIQIDPLNFLTPQGGINSAQSGIRLQLDCPTPEAEEPPDIVGIMAGQQEGNEFA